MNTKSFVDDGFEVRETFHLVVGRYRVIFVAESFVEFCVELVLGERVRGEEVSDRARRTNTNKRFKT